MWVDLPLGDIADRISILDLKASRLADARARAQCHARRNELVASWRDAGLPELDGDAVVRVELEGPRPGAVEGTALPTGVDSTRRVATARARHGGARETVDLPVLGARLRGGGSFTLWLDCGPGVWWLHGAEVRATATFRGADLRRTR